MASSSSLGLRIRISPEVAQSLRRGGGQSLLPSVEEDTKVDTSLHTSVSTSQEAITADGQEVLPGILIDIESMVGYIPEEEDELEVVQRQLLEAMWARYHQDQQQSSSSSKLGMIQDMTSTTNNNIGPPPDFDIQVLELFESGLARYHDDYGPSMTTAASRLNVRRDDGRLFISYPKYLQSPITGESILTMKLLRELRTPPSSSSVFIQNLWKYLNQCSRTLFWKRDMAMELAQLIQEEQTRLEYDEWIKSKRKKKLDNLYSIRETLLHQVEMSKTKVDLLEEEREDQVKIGMEPIQRKMFQKTNSSKQQQQDSLSIFGTTELSFPEEFKWLGLHDHNPDDQEDDWGTMDEGSCRDDDENYGYTDDHDDVPFDDDDDDDNSFDGDESSAGGESDMEKTMEDRPPLMNGSLSSPPLDSESSEIAKTCDSKDSVEGIEKEEEDKPTALLPFRQRKKRMERAKQRRLQDREKAETKARQEHLKKIESELRTKLTSKELIMAQTMHNALSTKMAKVEELLDSLQDEVWQAEEEEEAQEGDRRLGNDQSNEPTFSLLDQVLAMILGAMPNVDGKKPEEHYLSMQVEHRRIVEAWKSHFGRLPPPAGYVSTNDPSGVAIDEYPISQVEDPINSKEQREQLGITDNDEEDWEALDALLSDGEVNDTLPAMRVNGVASTRVPIQPKKQEIQPKKKLEDHPPAPRLVGLRPGGKVVLP